MVKLRDNIQEQLPFISVLHYGEDEYVGIIVNQDQYVTSFYDLSSIKTPEEKTLFLEIGEIWWWESNRMIHINNFLNKEIASFKYVIKNFATKDTKVLIGPCTSLNNIIVKRIKRRSITLVRRAP
jgi:hypothetical protein